LAQTGGPSENQQRIRVAIQTCNSAMINSF
jgi:hypothetical protein